MNEYDTNRIYDTVKNIGYFKTNDHLNADCYLLNTCHIRDKCLINNNQHLSGHLF